MDNKELLLLKLAYEEALKSPDPSTQNGALIISLDGQYMRDCNRFPDGVQYLPERWERPDKYFWIEHAERNVIFACSKYGIATNGATMVCGWAACSSCARAIIQAGIKTLITHKQAHDRSPDYWKKEIEIAMTMFKEAGVKVEFFDGEVGCDVIRHCGEMWKP